MFKLIFYGLLFYIIYKLIRTMSKILKFFSGRTQNTASEQTNYGVQNDLPKYKIDQKDIVDAEFTEMKNADEVKK